MKSFIKLLLFLFIISSFACNDDNPTNELPRIISTGNPKIDDLGPKIMAKPDDASLYAQRAVAYYEMKGYDEAIADLAKALRFDSTNIEYHYILSDVYVDYLQTQKALSTLERAVQIDPENVTSLLKLGRLQMLLKQHEPSLRTIDKVLKINNHNVDAFLLMGMNFELTGDDPRAINSYQSAIENDPNRAEIHMKLGQLFAKSGQKIALRYFDNAIAADPENAMTLYAKAEYLHNDDQLDEALITLKEAIMKDHQFVDAYFRTGVIYIEKDSLQKAYNQFDLVVQNDPASAKGFYYRGFSSEMAGDLSKAKSDYKQALVFAPTYQKAQEALARIGE